MSAAAVIMRRQKQIVRRFRDADATIARRARTLDELGMRSHWIFRHMAKKGVFVPVGSDRWYLDQIALEEFEARQWRRFLIFIGVFAIAFGLLLLFRC